MNEGRCKKLVPLRCNNHQISGFKKSDSLPAMNIPRKQNSRHFVSQRSRFRNIARFYHGENISDLLWRKLILVPRGSTRFILMRSHLTISGCTCTGQT
jgi:hypothetical protein